MNIRKLLYFALHIVVMSSEIEPQLLETPMLFIPLLMYTRICSQKAEKSENSENSI